MPGFIEYKNIDLFQIFLELKGVVRENYNGV